MNSFKHELVGERARAENDESRRRSALYRAPFKTEATPVFDKRRAANSSPNREQAIGFAASGSHNIEFRRDSRDRHVAKQNVTAILMGDPPPGRVKW